MQFESVEESKYCFLQGQQLNLLSLEVVSFYSEDPRKNNFDLLVACTVQGCNKAFSLVRSQFYRKNDFEH